MNEKEFIFITPYGHNPDKINVQNVVRVKFKNDQKRENRSFMYIYIGHNVVKHAKLTTKEKVAVGIHSEDRSILLLKGSDNGFKLTELQSTRLPTYRLVVPWPNAVPSNHGTNKRKVKHGINYCDHLYIYLQNIDAS